MSGSLCKERAISRTVHNKDIGTATVAKRDSTVQKCDSYRRETRELFVQNLACELLWTLVMKIGFSIFAVLLSLMLQQSSANAAPRKAAAAHADLTGLSEQWVLRAQIDEPDLLDVEQAALEHAQLADDPSRDWRKKARQSAALPTLSVGVETGYLNRANFNVQDSIAVNSSGVTIGPDANNINQYSTNQTMFTAKATWSLPDAVFHRQALAIEQQIRSRLNDRAKISERIGALYYERLHLKTILMATRKRATGHPIDRVALMTALQKVTGELNLMTGGWFGTHLKGGIS